MMANPLEKMNLDALLAMREAVLTASPEEDGAMKMGDMFSGQVTTRAERAAVLAQLDDAIAKVAANAPEKTQ